MIVKKRYTFVGRGRLYQHLSFYFESLGLDFYSWSRKQSSSELEKFIKNSDHILLAISDSALDPFLYQHPFIERARCVHFSGAARIEGVKACHPLMTFGPKLYSAGFYPQIPFIIDRDLGTKEIFPELTNPFYSIDHTQRALYHAYCVMGGNFVTLLWQEVGKKFEQELGLSKALLFPYFEKVLEQFRANPESALTGPFARKDKSTVKANMNALREDGALHPVYQAFVKAFAKEWIE